MKNSRISLLAVVVALLLFTVASFTFAQRRFLSIGGGSTGGTFNTFSTGISDYANQNIDGMNMNVEGSAGSGENIRRIQAGDLELGIAFAGDAYLAYNGLDKFEESGATDNLRAIGFLYGAVSQIVTLQGSGVESLADLAGKKVAVGGAGSGTQATIERLLNTLGIYDDLNPVLVAGLNASGQLKDGQVEAYHALYGIPNATVTDTSVSKDISIISSYDEAEEAGFFEQFPFYSQYVIPGGTFKGVDEDVTTFRDAGLWVVSAELDEETVYALTSAIYAEEGLAHMKVAAAAAGEMGPDSALVGIAIPLHAGAAQYWEEVGVEIPEDLAPTE